MQPSGSPPPAWGTPPPAWGPPRGPVAPPPRKSRSGCLLALGIVAAVLLLLAVLVGVVLYRAANSPGGRKVLGMVRDTARVVGEAATAPGTKELRGIGCESAMVMDMDAWLRVFGADGGVPKAGARLNRFVICGVRLLGTPPSCDRVAQTYVTAVGADAGQFQVMVQKQGRNRPVCAACYDDTGTRAPCPPGSVETARLNGIPVEQLPAGAEPEGRAGRESGRGGVGTPAGFARRGVAGR